MRNNSPVEVNFYCMAFRLRAVNKEIDPTKEFPSSDS